MELASKIIFSLEGIAQKDISVITGEVPFKLLHSESLVNGTGDSQANCVYGERFPIAVSTNKDVDLSDSANLFDIFGDPITFTNIKAFMVINRSDELDPVSAAVIEVGAAVSNPWYPFLVDSSDKIILVAGGAFGWSAPVNGVVVTAGTADILRIRNTSGSELASVDLLVLGVNS